MTILNNHVNNLIKELDLVARYLRNKGHHTRAYAVDRKIKSFNQFGRKYLPSETPKGTKS